MSQYISDETKKEIITKIKDDGMRVTDASLTYGVSTKSIYRWLRDGVAGGSQNPILELNRLRKENEQLYALLGRATAEMKRPKK